MPAGVSQAFHKHAEGRLGSSSEKPVGKPQNPLVLVSSHQGSQGRIPRGGPQGRPAGEMKDPGVYGLKQKIRSEKSSPRKDRVPVPRPPGLFDLAGMDVKKTSASSGITYP